MALEDASGLIRSRITDEASMIRQPRPFPYGGSHARDQLVERHLNPAQIRNVVLDEPLLVAMFI
jgi:hypothetical protein